MTSPTSSELKVVFGAMTFGKEGAEQSRTHDLPTCATILDIFQRHGHDEVDTARTYGGGSSEEYLAALRYRDRGLTLATKLSPRGFTKPYAYTHSAADVRRGLADSLAALGLAEDHHASVDLWYLHAPDHGTPYEETLAAVDALYREGRFRRFGLSNYAAWEVAQICEVCERRGWKRPDVYQGVYNALHRAVEPELLPCLRNYGIAFYAYNPLAGGFLTDRYVRDTRDEELGEVQSRFDPARRQGQSYRKRYWKDSYFEALDTVRPVCQRLGIGTAEAALRWIKHHSSLKGGFGDAVIVGASKAAQLEENLESLEKGPLPEELVAAFDEAWAVAKGSVNAYFV